RTQRSPAGALPLERGAGPAFTRGHAAPGFSGPLALDRAPADVVAVEGAVPGDAGDRRVGALLRILHAVAQRAHAQYPAAGGDHVPALHPGAGVEDPGVIGFGYVPGVDGVAD